jgi:gamma-glutamyltranspeptidase/glutathione hydrolase
MTRGAGGALLVKGGNAFDAGVASILVGGVIEQDLFSLGGDAGGQTCRSSSSGRSQC